MHDIKQLDYHVIVKAVLLLHSYLENTRFAIMRTHNLLIGDLNVTDSTRRLARWRLKLSEYESDVVHRPVIMHQPADGLSRLPATGGNRAPLENDLSILAVDVDENEKHIYVINTNCEEGLLSKDEPPLAVNTPVSKEETIFEKKKIL